MNTVACIIAKAESIRLPGKCLRNFCGLPLVEWTLLQAYYTRWINRIVFVTDSEEMAKIAEKYNAWIEWQPKEEIDQAEKDGKMGGTVTTLRGLKRAEKEYKEKNDQLHCLVSLLPTSPLRKMDDIDNAINLWHLNPSVPVVSFSAYKDLLLYQKSKTSMATLALFDVSGNFMRNTGSLAIYFPQQYRDCQLKDGKYIWGNNELLAEIIKTEPQRLAYVPFQQELWQEYDIDSQEDWDICEYFMNKNILQGRGSEIYKEYHTQMMSEHGYRQNAAQYNKGVEINLLPFEYTASFFNHFSLHLQSQKDEKMAGYELIEHYKDGTKKSAQYWRANSASDVLSIKLAEPKPALIIGSGLSLNEAGKYLKDWKGATFCSTSQATTLAYYGLDPTFVMAYDINSSPEEISKINVPWESKNSKLIIHAGVNPRLHEYWKGDKLLFRSMDTSNYFFANILPLAYGKIIPSQMFLFSCSLAAQISVAKAMGYSPLILVGCDFAETRATFYYFENNEWKGYPAKKSTDIGMKQIIAANGLKTDAMKCFYKRSVLCVWRIDHSQCLLAYPERSIITEMPGVNFEAVVAYQGAGFEEFYLNNIQIDDVVEIYLSRFNQFIVRFGDKGVRVVECGDEPGSWEQKVEGYMLALNKTAEQQGQDMPIDIKANMERFKWLKEQSKETKDVNLELSCRTVQGSGGDGV